MATIDETPKKINEAQKREILALLAGNKPVKEIAAQFGISAPYVYKIRFEAKAATAQEKKLTVTYNCAECHVYFKKAKDEEGKIFCSPDCFYLWRSRGVVQPNPYTDSISPFEQRKMYRDFVKMAAPFFPDDDGTIESVAGTDEKDLIG